MIVMAEQLGTFGEDYTASVLARRGFRIVARNFTVRGGEVDIIACNTQYILFVEVKTRGGGSLISAAEAVNRQKRRRITLAALLYLQGHPSDLQPRFDVACVKAAYSAAMGGLCVSAFDYLENAFFPEEGSI